MSCSTTVTDLMVAEAIY